MESAAVEIVHGGKRVKMNIGKKKVMVSGKNCGDIERLGKWPCTVCGKGVGSNSVKMYRMQ